MVCIKMLLAEVGVNIIVKLDDIQLDLGIFGGQHSNMHGHIFLHPKTAQTRHPTKNNNPNLGRIPPKLLHLRLDISNNKRTLCF